MIRHYKDWTIEIIETFHWAYDRGFRATAYVAKTNGTKADVREFARYSGIKNQKEMFEYTKKLLDI